MKSTSESNGIGNFSCDSGQAGRVAPELQILRFLPPSTRKQIADSFVPVSFPFGSVIVREGDPYDALYVLVSGQARVVKVGDHGAEVPLNSLRPGESFGE